VGRLSHAGPDALRWAAVEAAQQAWRSTNAWHALTLTDERGRELLHHLLGLRQGELALTWPPGIRWPRREVRHNTMVLATLCGTPRGHGHGSQDRNTPTINLADTT
jgi:hypothetical protein